MSYKVKLDIFEGPFDLLVYLIERSGMSIYQVNISEITEQYMEYVAALEEINPETAAEFMVLAATLIQIKSAMLLPSAKKADGTVAEEDPRDELARKIDEYKKIKYLSEQLKIKEYEAGKIYVKPREDISAYTDEPEENLNVDMDQFIKAFRVFIEKRQSIADVKKRYENIARERMTMEAKSIQVYERLEKHGKVDFSQLIDDVHDTYDIVLTFVTLLEMLRSGEISVVQEKMFGEMHVIFNGRKDGIGEENAE